MNYRNEINKLHKENKAISEQIEKLMAEQDWMCEHYKPEVFRNPELRKRYFELDDNLDELNTMRIYNNGLIDELKSEYRAAHEHDEYFRIMDEIDIRVIIGRDGFIIAVKF